LAELFLEILREEGIKVEEGIGESEDAFFNDALSALASLSSYEAPFYLQLSGFQQVEASGLQVTHSGGTFIVYAGFLLLVTGVFIMFYTSHRRIWVWLAVEEGATRLVVAGTANRRQADFSQEFSLLQTTLSQRLGVAALALGEGA